MSDYLKTFLGIWLGIVCVGTLALGSVVGTVLLLEWLRSHFGVGGAILIFLAGCSVVVAALTAIPASRKDRQP